MSQLIFRILYTLITFLQTLIVFRIILSVIDADIDHPLVSWIYVTTDIFINPFRGIVAEEIILDNRFQLEITPIIALVFYAILAFVFSELAKSFSKAKSS
jgi:uncharacterized protein YggT (Ycf19 family)